MKIVNQSQAKALIILRTWLTNRNISILMIDNLCSMGMNTYFILIDPLKEGNHIKKVWNVKFVTQKSRITNLHSSGKFS